MKTTTFDDQAAEWDKNPSRRRLADAVSAAIGRLPLARSMRAMDFGCGTGLISLPLAPRLGSITAFDSSAGMIEVLQKKLVEKDVANVVPRCGSLLEDELEGGFDLIFTSMTLHHIEDIEPILASLFSLLAPGGRLAAADLDAEDGTFHSTEAEDAPHHGFARAELAAALSRCGFTAIAFETVHTISKPVADGTIKDFTVFMVHAHKK